MADEHVPMDYYEYDINKVDVGFCTSDDDDQMESPIDSVKKDSLDSKLLKKKSKSHIQPNRPDLAAMDSESVVLLLNNLFFKENNSISEIERKSLSITSNSIIESSKNQLIYSNIFKHLPEKEEIVSMKNCQIVIISSAALRCIEIMKLIISGNKKIKIVKLFAKHIKIKEQVALLKKQKHQLAVATPTRFSALIDILPDLKMNLKYIFIDSSRDAKERTIFDIPETGKPLLDLIYIKLGESIRSGRVKLVFLKQ